MTLENSAVILCVKLIKFDKYCKVDKCSGKRFFFLTKYDGKLDKSFGRKVEIHQRYLWCSAKTAQIWKKQPQNISFLPELDGFRIRRSVLERVSNTSGFEMPRV